MSLLLDIQNLSKHYQLGGQRLQILNGLGAKINKGEWVCIYGASGSGKSTMLHLLAALDMPDEGDIQLAGQSIFDISPSRRERYRNRNIGLVFQFYHLLPELNVLENTVINAMIGTSIFGWPGQRGKVKQHAVELLNKLGLGERLHHKPAQLSGGERQRVAIARALINEPQILLADEPTGNLDRHTGEHILKLFDELHAEGHTIVMVTHDDHVAARADRTLVLEDGKLHERSVS